MAFNVGDVLKGSDFPIHPKYGARPDLEILEVNEDGSKWKLGRIKCTTCQKPRDLHPGDFFQVRSCLDCKPTKAKKAKADGTTAQTPKLVLKGLEKAANDMHNQVKEKLENLRQLGRR
jgi:formate dehydrogenase maturation protein FdhE